MVVGLNLCPWAKGAVDEGLVNVILSQAESVDELVGEIRSELQRLAPDAVRHVCTEKERARERGREGGREEDRGRETHTHTSARSEIEREREREREREKEREGGREGRREMT